MKEPDLKNCKQFKCLTLEDQDTVLKLKSAQLAQGKGNLKEHMEIGTNTFKSTIMKTGSHKLCTQYIHSV